MPLITADRLTRAVESILVAAGADDSNARRVADALVLSDLSGIATHGVQHVPGYVRAIRDGEVLPAAKPSIASETGTSALVKGNWTFGFVSAKLGLDLAIDKARSHGMSTVGVVQVNHIGRLGEYAELAAENGMISITWASGYGKLRPVAIPYGRQQAPAVHQPDLHRRARWRRPADGAGLRHHQHRPVQGDDRRA